MLPSSTPADKPDRLQSGSDGYINLDGLENNLKLPPRWLLYQGGSRNTSYMYFPGPKRMENIEIFNHYCEIMGYLPIKYGRGLSAGNNTLLHRNRPDTGNAQEHTAAPDEDWFYCELNPTSDQFSFSRCQSFIDALATKMETYKHPAAEPQEAPNTSTVPEVSLATRSGFLGKWLAAIKRELW